MSIRPAVHIDFHRGRQDTIYVDGSARWQQGKKSGVLSRGLNNPLATQSTPFQGEMKMVPRIDRIVMVVALFAQVVLGPLCGVVMAGPNDPDTPNSIIGGKIISADDAKALIDKRSAAVFDMRTPLNYGKGHIPTAVSVPYKGKSENIKDFDPSSDQVDFTKFPQDKATKIIVYSDGPKGWKSYKMSVAAIRAGYKDVLWLREGFAVWEKKNYPLEKQ